MTIFKTDNWRHYPIPQTFNKQISIGQFTGRVMIKSLLVLTTCFAAKFLFPITVFSSFETVTRAVLTFHNLNNQIFDSTKVLDKPISVL